MVNNFSNKFRYLGAFVAAVLFLLYGSPLYCQKQKQDAETVAPSVRKQAKTMALRFRQSNRNLETRNQIADEAIQLGEFQTAKILEAVLTDKVKWTKSYGTSFFKQIPKAKQITRKGVIASSENLKQTRAELIGLSEIEGKLRKALSPDVPAENDDIEEQKAADGDNDEDNKNSAESPSKLSAFEKALISEEEAALKKWYVANGYGTLSAEELSVIADINRLREQAGLKKLEIDYKLCFAARDHSNDMVRKQFFSHNSPVKGKKTYAHRGWRVGTRAYGENIAICNRGESPFTLWINSKPHKRNMLTEGFNTVGVGRSGRHYTAMFGRKPPAKKKNTDSDE